VGYGVLGRVATNPGFFSNKPNPVGFWVFWVKPGFAKRPSLMGSGISMGFQLLE